MVKVGITCIHSPYCHIASILMNPHSFTHPLPSPPLLQETEALGYIRLEEMLSVSRCEEELSRDPTHRHCFEVNTQSRGYLLCAETEEDMDHWVGLFNQVEWGGVSNYYNSELHTLVHCVYNSSLYISPGTR